MIRLGFARQKTLPNFKSFGSETTFFLFQNDTVELISFGFRLAGKLEMSMCLMLHSAIVIEENENLNYLTVIRKVLQSHVHRYYACSAR